MDPISNFPEVPVQDPAIAPNGRPETLTSPPKVDLDIAEEFKVPFAISTSRDYSCLCGNSYTHSRNYFKHMAICRVVIHAELRPNPKYETQDGGNLDSSDSKDLICSVKVPRSPIAT